MYLHRLSCLSLRPSLVLVAVAMSTSVTVVIHSSSDCVPGMVSIYLVKLSSNSLSSISVFGSFAFHLTNYKRPRRQRAIHVEHTWTHAMTQSYATMTHPLDASTSTRTRTQPIIPQIQHTPTSPTIIDITNPSNTSPSSHQPNSTQTSNGIPPSSTADTLAPVMPEKFDRFESPAGAYPTGRSEGWEEAFEAQRLKRWEEKVTGDLKRWRGGNG